jgi:hypothetical protein
MHSSHREQIEVICQLYSNVTFFTGIETRTHETGEHVCPDMYRKTTKYNVIGQAIPLQAWTGPQGSRSLRIPDFKTIGT